MNTHWFEQFEEYLNGEMSREDKILFEAALSADEELSGAFRLYRTIEKEMRNQEKYSDQENALRNSLQTLNSRYFKSEPRQTAKVIKLKSNNVFKYSMAIAASLLLLLVAYFVFLQPTNDPRQLATNYFDTQLSQLSQTMDASQDSLQLGISAYNNKDYKQALQYFQGIYKAHPDNSEAKRNIGLVYLATKDYNKALQQFDELAAMKNLYSNPGLFLKAITLMQRNKEGDQQKAQQLLQQVVAEKAEGSREAAEWLKKF